MQQVAVAKMSGEIAKYANFHKHGKKRKKKT